MTSHKITNVQRTQIAQRLALLPESKKAIFRQTLEKQGIDPWQLPIVPTPLEQDYPLSYSQQRLWFIEQMEAGNPMYNEFFALRFVGDLQLPAFKNAINKVIARHHILRTNYLNIDGEGRQRVHDFVPFTLNQASLPAADSKALHQMMREEAKKPFDLSSDPHMIRATLVSQEEPNKNGTKKTNKTIGLFTVHHIAFDALSIVYFMQELDKEYRLYNIDGESLGCELENNKASAENNLQPKQVAQYDDSLQYKDYAQWQREWAGSSERQRQADYWQQQLADAPASLNIATQYKRPEVMTYQGSVTNITLPVGLSKRISALAKQQNATLYMVMLAVFNILLSRYSRQNDVCVGTSISNRPGIELEELIGFFVNTLVMRNQVNDEASFSSFLTSVNDVAINAYSHKDLPFDQLLTLLDIDREQNTTPLFQALFVLNNALDELSLDLGDVDVSIYPTKQHYSRFDLSLRVTESATVSGVNGLSCEMEYNTALYSQDMIDNMLSHYQHLLEQIVDNPKIELKQLSILSSDEVQTVTAEPLHSKQNKTNRSSVDNVTADNSATATSVIETGSIQAKVEYWAKNTPHNAAIIYEQQHLTYQQLNQQANRLARFLRQQGVSAEKPVAILFDRSGDFIISMLAVLKAGTAYVPLDHQWPAERLEQIVNDCDVSVIISQSKLQSLISSFNGDFVLTDNLNQELTYLSDKNLSLLVSPKDAAYLIYTSGSTGTPKGVVIEHRHLLHYISNVETRFALAGRSFALISTMAADLGNTSIYGALCFGGSLHVLSEDRAKDANALTDYCQQNNIDVLKIVPSHLQGLLAALESENASHILPKHCLILGGEACSTSLIEQVQTLAPQCRIINHYGPTEATVGALAHEISLEVPANNLFNENLPIGRPLNGNRVYIVDQCLQLCPIGVPGELWISGGSVARGYHNRPELTSTHFVANSFLNDAQDNASYGKCYRTGDRVRRLSNGEIEFLGRLDSQIKIRGYRVELGEIESALHRIKGVQQAVVLTTLNEIGQNQLAAYIVLDDEVRINDVQQTLQAALPDYMMPQWLLPIEQMPVTRNGKVDRKALPSPQSLLSERDVDNTTGKAPADEKEQTIVDIWSAILGVDTVYADDNFFELGGDSILSLQVIAKAKRAGLKLLPKQLFEHQTVEALAKVAVPLALNKPVADSTVTGDVAITPIQDWFFTSEHTQQEHWNQSLILQAKQPLNATALASAVSQLVRHHDQLRCSFSFDNNLAKQQVLSWSEQLGKQYYVQAPLSNEFAEQVNQYQSGLSFAANNNVGQLFKLVHFTCDDSNKESDKDRLLLVAHHLLVDGVSWRILMEDLLVAYQHALSGATGDASFSSKTMSFKAWSEQLQQAAKQTNAAWYLESSKYWQTMSDQLNADHPLIMPARSSSTLDPSAQATEKSSRRTLQEAQTHSVSLDKSSTKALLQAAPKAYKTRVNDLLLSALAIAIQDQCPDEPLYVELEGHGREDLIGSFESLDVSRTVGWFTSRFPLLLNGFNGDSQVENSTGMLIQSIKEQLRAVPSNGLAYGVLTRLGDMPLLARPAVSFNYLGQVDADQKNGINAFELMSNVMGVVERHIDNTATHALSINAMVVNDELTVNLQSIDGLCGLELQSFGENYLNALQIVIQHCGDQSIANTPSDFPLANINQDQLDSVTDQVGLEHIDDIYGLTSLQEGILFHTLMAGSAEQQSDSAYFNQLLVNVDGEFKHDIFIDAWQLMFERHQLLRSSFWANSANEPVQIVHKRSVLPVTYVDLQSQHAEQQKTTIQQIMLDDRATGFDLQQAPLMRLHLIQLSANRWQVLWSRHHLLLDGWSSSRLMQEVMVTYQAMVKQLDPFAHPLLSNTPTPFSQYIAWLQQQDDSKAEGFWKNYLQGASNPVQLPFTRNNSGHQSEHIQLSLSLSQQLDGLAKLHKVTLNTLIQSAWGLLLASYSNSSASNQANDVIFGMTSAGRSTGLASVEEMLGLFINTLPVRVALGGAEQTLGNYLSDMQLNQANVRDYEHVSLPRIQTWSEVDNGQSLFETLLVFENYFVDDQAKDLLKGGDKDSDRLTISAENSHEPTNYPITLVVLPNTDKGIELRFATHNIDNNDLNRLIEHYQSILNSFVDASENTPLSDMMQLPESQRSLIVNDWNDSLLDVPDVGVDVLFSQQAKATPSQLAVQFKNQHLNYAELEVKSNQLAHLLQAQGVGPNHLVGIVQQRSLSLLVSVLGVMKAGAAYVPIDPNYPKDRVHYMLEHSGLGLLLADQVVIDGDLLPAHTEESSYKLINTDQLNFVDGFSEDLPVTQAKNSDLAYVIYTSGSTGKPKGVQITRGNLSNFISGMQQLLKPTAEDSLLAVTSLSFDIAALELYLPLVCGAKVIMADEQLSMDGERLKSTIEDNRVSLMQATPVTWKLLLSANWNHSSANSSFTALCGGEAFPLDLANTLLEQPIRVWNLYGPTETTVWSAAYELSGQEGLSNTVPIGRPIANTQLYVLDSDLNPVPIGVTGELYIAGAGVALGYLHNPDLTFEQFIENDEFGRLYQTGDLARYRDNGILECLGRIDTQVKVRGYRIELGEIEHCVLQHKQVVDAVVNPVTITGEPVLAAYVVLDNEYDDTKKSELLTDIKEQSGKQLPGYMVPSLILSLDALPLTPNGKIDRKALPTPDSETQLFSQQLPQYQPPETETQAQLCDIWQQVLGVEHVGINDNFFELGGHSLLVMRLQTKIADELNADLTLQQMFAHQTIALLADLVDKTDNQVSDGDLDWMNNLIDGLED